MRSLKVDISASGRIRTRKPKPKVKKEEIYSLTDDKQEADKKSLTLAQKLGLVPAPPSKLTREEWMSVAEKSRGRQDSCSDCAICRESFRADAQVILSCSHVFHQDCLASFERFAGVKSCPLCRMKNYEKRLFEDGRRNWEKVCAVKVQSVWRGHAGRKIYNHLVDTVVPTDPEKRRQFYYKRMEKLSTRLFSALDAERDHDLDDLFKESELALQFSRDVFGESARAGGRGGGGGGGGEVDWEMVEAKALQRDEQDCAICLCDLGGPSKKKVLTSCSHIFHANCLESFERFSSAMAEVDNLCPCCRSKYKKRFY